jgi:adenosylcobinamide kinase / adenosylcobinamide-phosphate guanylyltransferase
MTMSEIVLVLGGARSGKSRFAEARLLARPAGRRVYLATAEPLDDEMTARIAAHRAGRAGHGWQTVEAPLALPEAIVAHAGPDVALLVDCLSLWLSNRLLADADLDADRARLLAALAAAEGSVTLVANEVGLSLVPDNPLGRRFRDAAGLLNQAVAAIADEVQLLVAGLPLRLK